MEIRKLKIKYKKKFFVIRNLKPSDVNSKYVLALKNEKFLQTIPKKINIQIQKKIIKKINKSKIQKLIGFFYKDKLLGTSGFQNFNKKKINIGVFLFHKSFKGKGFGKFFIWTASFFMFHFYNKKYFIAGIKKSNIRSIGAFKGGGFKFLNKKKDSFNYFLKIESKKPKFIKNIEIFF
tara:strand:+ start:907 stop:1440 length:534 start_codon:yes stop_codon:yes gene_type:complete